MTPRNVIQKFFGEVVDPLPCPFCGSDPSPFTVHKEHNWGNPYYFAEIRCSNKKCGVTMSFGVTEKHWDTRSKVVTEIGVANAPAAWGITLWNDVYSKWNRRA